MTEIADPTACRLCQEATVFAFKTVVLGKYDVSYYRCRQCGSLQTERPYWLGESYAEASSSIDTGSARRVLDSYVLVDIIARLLRCRRLLDFGGNTGFLCRLLRDRGFDAYSFDRYVTAVYAPHFVGAPSDQYDLISAIEVIEHFAEPLVDLDQIFCARPGTVLATTELYTGQLADWWYLAPREGQHVFLYSEGAVRLIAKRYGYELVIGRGFLLFSRAPIPLLLREFIRVFLRPRILRVVAAWSLTRRGSGAESDFTRLTQRNLRN
jgi:Methyltransferase domain